MGQFDNLTKTAAGITALVGVLGSLAVAGILERVQREHPHYIFFGIALVVVGALLFLFASLIDGETVEEDGTQ